MFTKVEIDNRSPVVLVLAEPDLLLADYIKDIYRGVGYKVIHLDLDENFFNTSQQFIQNSDFDLHKVVLLYGFKSCIKEYYSLVIDFLGKLHAPLVLLSFLPTNISFLAKQDLVAVDFYQKRIDFLKQVRDRVKNALVFIAQDLLLSGRFTSYPLLYFFSYLHEQQIIDLQNTLYPQDEKSFADLIKPHLLKPHFTGNYLIRGKKQNALKIAQEIAYLYEQYFQQPSTIFKILTSTENNVFLREFVVINNTNTNYSDLIDQKVRNLTDLIKAEQTQFSLEEMQYLAVRQQQELNKKTTKVVREVANQVKKPIMMNLIGLFQKNGKKPLEPVVDVISHEQLEQKVELLFSTQRQVEKEIRQESNIITGQEIVKKTKKRKWLFWLGASFSVFGLMFLLLISLFNFSQEYLQKQLFLAVKNDINEVKNIDDSIIYSIFSIQYEQYRKILPVENLTIASDIKQLNDSLLRLIEAKADFSKQGFELYQRTIKGGVDLQYFYLAFEQALDRKIEAEKGFNAYLMSLNLELFTEDERSVWQEQSEETKRDLQMSLKHKRFLTAFKDLLLSDGRKTIAIVLQDSNELRGSGGIVTEIMLLSFEKGTLVDRQLLSAEDLNQRVYGKREASEELKKTLGEDIFHLRDVSWSADFNEVARDANWFLSQALGQRADLVFGIHTKSINHFISTFDGLKLRNDQVFVAGDYLAKLRESALSDAKKTHQDTYSWQVTQLVFDQLFVFQESSFNVVFNSLVTALENQEAYLFVDDSSLNQVLLANSWASRQAEANCPVEFNQENCQIDSIVQIENNIGFNKVGEFIARVINHDIGVTTDFIRHRRKISWENQAPSPLWPLGSYRFYVKFILPQQVVIEKIQVDQKELSEGEYVLIESGDNKELGLILEVRVDEKLDLVITYVLPNLSQSSFSYLFTDRKQAGELKKISDYAVVFTDELSPRLIAPIATFENKTVRFSNDGSSNFFFAIDFIDSKQAK